MKLKLLFLSLLITMQVFSQNTNEQTAKKWLEQHKKDLNINKSSEFRMLFNRNGLSGETFRYYQFEKGIQVLNAEVVIHISNKTGLVSYHSSSYNNNINITNVVPTITKEKALQIVQNKLNLVNINYVENGLYLYTKDKNTHLVYRIITRSEDRTGAWETIIDAKDRTILSTKDIAFYYDKHKKQAHRVTPPVNGTGMVYDTDPLTATLNTYGGQYSDNNDATNASLDAARTSVTLIGIEQNGGSYRLKGQYTEIAELEAPSTGLFIQNSPNFNFTRDQQGFEAVNVYYHTDKSIRYINETLNINLVSLYNGGVLRYDPHAANGDDNSYYTGGTLNFGEGGIDDGEDADVILHELGHGLHDWITNGALSQVNGLSEGCGDYWANSYKRSLGQWNSTDAQYNWVFGWDGHNEYWNGRVTNNNTHYPDGLVGQIHQDGTIWASCLMEIWEYIGKENMDKAFLEGLAMINNNTNQQDAAIAVRQAAIDMGYSCDHINYMTDRFEARGYVLPTYNCSDFALDVTVLASIPSIDCGSNNVTPTITLKNIGSTTVTSATIVWNFDNGTNTTINWTGSLVQYAEEVIPVGTHTLASATHTFNVTVSNPNGGTDQGSTNNSVTENFEIKNAYQTTQIHLELTPDDYGSETTWNFKNANGTIIYSGGPYTNGNTTTINESFNVPNSECYSFEIIDGYGDGICCTYGNGSYSLTTDDSTVIFSGASFGSNEITEIAINQTASVNEELAKNITIYPNPTNNTLNVNLNSISGEFTYSLVNTLGQFVLQGNLLNNTNKLQVSQLDKGIYFLKIINTSTSNYMVEKIIIN